jgi:hypothetical protein
MTLYCLKLRHYSFLTRYFQFIMFQSLDAAIRIESAYFKQSVAAMIFLRKILITKIRTVTIFQNVQYCPINYNYELRHNTEMHNAKHNSLQTLVLLSLPLVKINSLHSSVCLSVSACNNYSSADRIFMKFGTRNFTEMSYIAVFIT